MKINPQSVRQCLKAFDFTTLFLEHLGWDQHHAQLDVPVGQDTYALRAVSQKRGFTAFVCDSIPDRATRLKIDHQVTKSAREHFVVYADQSAGQQVWHWVRREPGKPLASRDHRFDVSQSGDALIQRLDNIAVSMEEEEELTLFDVTGRNRAAFDVDKVTKKFYDRFKTEHTAFLKLISGFPGPVKVGGKSEPHPDLQWYTSLMLNRLMFVYFIQKKGFLDGDLDYLRTRLAMVQQQWCRRPACQNSGKDGSRDGRTTFLTFYRYFLLRLFHDGLGKSPGSRALDPAMEKLLGRIPYLNGGFFEVHKLERDYADIDIPDEAFVRLFDFFDQYNWHLDERPLRQDNEINPDVVGYIFEKYINHKQMGAYYTKEDITEYISKNTIIPYLFDAAKKKCAIAFKAGSALWRLLTDDPDRYIYAAVRHGVVDEQGNIIPLPANIAAGIPDVAKRTDWNKAAVEPYALPTETWREHVARRQRCLEIREILKSGAGVPPADSNEAAGTAAPQLSINDLITLNLDIWQFARDVIVNAEGPELLRAFWQAIQTVTVLDPTCGSGAFVFAALRILETLYSDCLERMERFVEDDDAQSAKSGAGVPPATSTKAGQRPAPHSKYRDFRDILAQIAKHPNDRYFTLKSIIINNLFGVDIMEEAVEICKLRLFLKLVAQVETFEQLEPLPDVDFNIRAGNTLVGFASMEQVKQSMQGDMIKLMELPRIEESAELAARAFQQFRDQQTTHGGAVTPEDKQALRERLRALDDELDRYLAAEYGVNVDKPADFDAWKKSHQPFHWLVEFYSIMHAGGFCVIIGNPPYVEYKNVASYYRLQKGQYLSPESGNLYAFCMERASILLNHTGYFGMIVPTSLVGLQETANLRLTLLSRFSIQWFSTYAIRPSKLFDGVDQRLCVYLASELQNQQVSKLFTGGYRHWSSDERVHLFCTLKYTESFNHERLCRIPQIGTPEGVGVLQKLEKMLPKSANHFYNNANNSAIMHYHRSPRYWIRGMDFEPHFKSATRARSVHHFRDVYFENPQIAKFVGALINSSLFFFWFLTVGNGRNIAGADIELFPIGDVNPSALKCMERAFDKLMEDYKSNSIIRSRADCEFQEFRPSRSKPIIDEIDRVLAEHYGFTDEELDYIINYDIKYRMGGAEKDGE